MDPAILTSMAQRPVQGFNLSKTQLNIYVGVDASPEVRKAIVAGDYVNLATWKPGYKNKQYSHTAHVDDNGAS